MKKNIFIIIVLIAAAGVLSCVSTGEAAVSGQSDRPLYYGSSKGDSAIKAMNAAKLESVRKAADDILEKAASSAKREELDNLFDSVSDSNAFIFKNTLTTLDQGKEGNFYFYNLSVRINLEALANFLMANDIYGGQIDGSSVVNIRLPDETAPFYAADKKEGTVEKEREPSSAESSMPSDADSKEMAFIDEYLNRLTYMVYYNEEIEEDTFLTKTAVVSANKYLYQNGMEYIDLKQIETIKKDQDMVYEEETGESVSIIQWIARKLNADVYIEVSLSTSSSKKGDKYYGSAAVTLNCYEASTAEGRGSATYQTKPPAFSTVSEKDALNNAVAAAVFKAMPVALSTAKKETRKALLDGIKYKLVIINTEDSRVMRDFMKRMGRKVKSIKKLSYSPEKAEYAVYFIGTIEGFEDVVYDVTESMPELEGISLIMQQGNSLTFDSGL